jgi:hypothetical protein
MFEGRPPVSLVHGEHNSGGKLQDLLEKKFGSSVNLTIPGLRLYLREMRLRAG